MRRLEGGQDVEVVRVHSANAVVSGAVVENVLVGGLSGAYRTKVKMSWFFYFSSKAWLGFNFRKSHTSRLPPLAVPFPPVKI